MKKSKVFNLRSVDFLNTINEFIKDKVHVNIELISNSESVIVVHYDTIISRDKGRLLISLDNIKDLMNNVSKKEMLKEVMILIEHELNYYLKGE